MFKKKYSIVPISIITAVAFVCIFLIMRKIHKKENSVEPKVKVVYLTFDADMTPFMKEKLNKGIVSSYYSKDLVNYLENKKIPTTIFVTGMFAEIYPDLIKNIAKYPFIEIANHSYDHPGFESPCYGLSTIDTTAEKIQEMKKTQQILTPLIGYAPKYFRHPGLCHDKQDDLLAQNIGLTVSDSGVISGDAFNKNSENITKTLVNKVYAGAAIIMHFGGANAPATAVAVKNIVDKLKAEGYVFKIL